MGYVNGFVVPVPKKRLEAYRRVATAGKVWRGHGAPAYQPMMDPKAMPFDGKRMFWGDSRSWSSCRR